MTLSAIQLCEIAMLVSFSTSWYCSVWKMVRTRKAAGKSAAFVSLIAAGYVAGILAKLLIWRETGLLGVELAFYVMNLMVVSVDLALVIIISREEATARAAPVLRERLSG